MGRSSRTSCHLQHLEISSLSAKRSRGLGNNHTEVEDSPLDGWMGCECLANHIRSVRFIKPPNSDQREQMLFVSETNLQGIKFESRKVGERYETGLQSVVFTLICGRDEPLRINFFRSEELTGW